MHLTSFRPILIVAFALSLVGPVACDKGSSSGSPESKDDDKKDKKKSKGDDDDDDDKSEKKKKKKKASDDEAKDDEKPSKTSDDPPTASASASASVTTKVTGAVGACGPGFSKPTFDSPCLQGCNKATGKQETCAAGFVCTEYKTWTGPHCQKGTATASSVSASASVAPSASAVPTVAAMKCVLPSAPPCKAPWVESPKGLCQIPCASGDCSSCNGNCQKGFCVPKSPF